MKETKGWSIRDIHKDGGRGWFNVLKTVEQGVEECKEPCGCSQASISCFIIEGCIEDILYGWCLSIKYLSFFILYNLCCRIYFMNGFALKPMSGWLPMPEVVYIAHISVLQTWASIQTAIEVKCTTAYITLSILISDNTMPDLLWRPWLTMHMQS